MVGALRLLDRETRRGFLALLPLWPGVVSIGLVYAVVSRDAGLGAIEIQLLSLFVYSGAGQFAFTSMTEDKASALAIIGTVALLNIRHVLYGISAQRWLPADSPPKPILAQCLVDEAYGIAEAEVNRGRPNGWFLLGAGISLFLAWNMAVAAGLVLDTLIEVPTDIGLDFIFPLSFVALTIPLIRHSRHMIAAAAAIAITVAVSQFADSGIAVFAATMVAIGVAVMLEPRDGS